MVVLGVDPGTRFAGYGVLGWDGCCFRVLGYGLVDVSRVKSYSRRLLGLHEEVLGVLERYGPEVVVVEEVFYGKNFRSAVKIGEARGVVFLAAAVYDLVVFEYSPSTVKQAVTGSGRASKQQVRQMVGRLLGLEVSSLRDDVSDALAIAICHCHRVS